MKNFLFFLILFVVNQAGGQEIVSITGPSAVEVEEEVTYSFYASDFPATTNWSYAGATVISESSTRITLKWQEEGTKTVSVSGNIYNGSYYSSYFGSRGGIEVSSSCSSQLSVGDIPSEGVLCLGESLEVGGYSGGDGEYAFQWQQRGVSACSTCFTNLSGATSASYTPSASQIGGGYTLRVKVMSCGQTAYTQSVTLSLPTSEPLIPGTVSGGDVTFCSGDPIPTLSLSDDPSGGTGTWSYQWQRSPIDYTYWADVSGARSKTYQPRRHLDYFREKYRVKITSCGSTAYTNAQYVIELPTPESTTTGTLSTTLTEICPYVQVPLRHIPHADTPVNALMLQGNYRGVWEDRRPFSSTNMEVRARPGEKFRVLYESECVRMTSNEVTFSYREDCNVPSSFDRNFIRTEVAKVPIQTEHELSIADPWEKVMTYEYYDGAGRSLQRASVGSGIGFSDVYSFNVYERNGREEKAYLPYVTDESFNGRFRGGIIEKTEQLYLDTYADSKPYSQTFYESESSGKVTSRLGVGEQWHTNDKRQHVTSYWNDGTEGILRWGIANHSDTHDELDKPQVLATDYSAEKIYFQEVISEEGIRSRTGTDLSGRKVVSQIYSQGNWLSSYTVYDNMHRVRYSIPPLASSVAEATHTLTDAQIEGMLFQTTYDRYGRVIKSKSPGSGWSYVVYDAWGRTVLTQDASQRERGDYWTFVKYDDWNREILTGETRIKNTPHEQLMETLSASDNEKARYETVAPTTLGYTLDASYPSVEEEEVLTVHYYDNYDFLTLPSWDESGHDYSYQPPAGMDVPSQPDQKTIDGTSTGSKVRILSNSQAASDHGDNPWLHTVIYLDARGRIIQTVGENHLKGIDRVSNAYDWQGQMLSMHVEHSTHPEGTEAQTLDLHTRYVYDHAGNLLETHQQTGDGPSVLLAQYEYNKFGELKEKNLHSTDGGTSFLQSLDYTYTIRGWLDEVNNVHLTDEGTDSQASSDLYGAKYHYTHATNVHGQELAGRYDGNLIALETQTKDSPQWLGTRDTTNRLHL